MNCNASEKQSERFNSDGSRIADEPTFSIQDARHLTTQDLTNDRPLRLRADYPDTSFQINGPDGKPIATIKHGIFRVHVEPTDGNAKQFIEIVNNYLKMYKQPELKEVISE